MKIGYQGGCIVYWITATCFSQAVWDTWGSLKANFSRLSWSDGLYGIVGGWVVANCLLAAYKLGLNGLHDCWVQSRVCKSGVVNIL